MKNFVEINRTFTVKKNLLIFKSSFYEKLKLLIIPMMLITLGVGQMWGDYTWYSGDLLYYDFTAVTSGGVNWHNGSSLQYDASGYGKVKKVEFSSTVTMNNSWVIAKTGKGSWTDIKFSNPTSVNQRRFIINADGTSGSWGYLDKYIAGDNWGGVGNWSTTTKKMTNNNNGSYTVTLTSVAASAHKFKITNYDTWTGAVGYSANVSCENGTVADDGTGNIQFTPYIAGNVTISYNASTGVITITCPKIPITLNKNSGASNGSATVDVGASSLSSITHVSRDYYDLTGYWTESSGGYKVITAAGAFVTYSSNVSDYLNNASPATWKKTSATTLYAQWTPKTYTITYLDKGGSSYSGSNSASLPSSYTYGTGIASLTDGVKSGYRFDGWYTNSTCTEGPVTSISSSATGNKTFYAKWTENPGGTVTLTAGTGGQVSKDGSSWGASKSYSGIKTTDALNIYAQANDGYVFSSWTRTSGTGTIASTSSASTTYTPVANADAELTANFSAKTNALSVSSSTLYAGDNITLSATRTNHSLNLTYQYKIGSGSWTDIATQSGTSKTWQIPYANTYQTYKFRVKSTDGSVDIISSEQTVNVKGRITIHVKNTNSWASMYLYSWYSTSTTTNGAWPGKTGTGLNNQSCSIHATGSQWWDVTITQETATAQKFILNCNTSGDQYQTGNLNLSDFTHDAYYAMSTNASSNQTLSTTTTPAAPTLSTSAAGTIRETSAVLGGNVTNLGNDIISERGYYWSTNSALSSSNLGVGTKVTVSGTQSSTGTFSSTKSSLTAGTKYYFIAYAKNGYGTSYGDVNNFTTLSTYTVTVTAGDGGTASPSSVTAGQYQLSGTITASASTGYTFYNWTKTSGSGTVTFTNANANSTTVKSTSTATVRANFVDQWNLKGDQWSSFGEYKPMTATANANEYNLSLSLTKGTKYQFKVVKRAYNGSAEGTTDTWYGTTDGAGNKVFERGESAFTTVADGMNNNLEVTADVTGTYTFTINTSGSTPVITVTYPTAYTITYGVGAHNGSSTAVSVSPSFTSGDYVLPETDVTFSKGTTKTGYTWKGWYSKDDGTGTLHSSTDANLSWTATRTGNISVYACYNVVNYTITYNLNGGSNPGGAPTGFTIESSAITLPTPSKTGYTFNGWYENADLSTGGVKTTIPAGSTGNKVYYAKWTPITYTIHFNGNGNTSGSMSNQTGVTYDAATTITANAFAKTGYNFGGWATTQERANAGTVDRADGAAHGNLASTQGATAQLWAIWIPKQSALTLDKQTSATGYGGNAGTVSTSAVSATYDAAMPTLSGTMPTAANGYAFMGFYDATGGGGTKYYNADGSSARNWDKDTESGTTLYAYYKKAEITNITFSSGAIVAPNTSITATATLSPSPAGTTHIDWKLRYGNDNALADQPSFGTETTTASFSTPAASGTYKLEAVLRTGSTPNAGTTLDSVLYSLTVAGDHTVTVRYKCGDDVIKAATTVTGRPLAWSDDITAPTIVGYTFVRWDAGDGVSIKNGESDPVTTTTDATIKIKAIYDGTLTAVYSQKRVIYFYNTLNWENVYVYFYKNESYWGGSNQGTGANTSWQLTGYPYSEGLHGQMLPVEEGSKIYYFDAEAAGVNASYTNVAFTELNQHPCDYFYNNNKVVRRSDYHSTTMPLFVPLGDQTGVKMNSNTATYYSNGYWMNYPLNTGYTLKIYNAWNVDNATGAAREIPFPYSEDLKMPLKLNVEFNDAGNHNYWFMIKKNDGNHHGVNYTINQNYNDEQALTSGKDKLKLVTSAPGIYTFTLTYHDNGSGTVNYYIDVDFPVALNDYRIVYKDNATWSNGAHTASWSHPSDVITKIAGDATEAKKDTLSFYISKGEGITPSMKFQYASAINESTGAITWTDVTSGSITIPSAVVTAPGVYNFVVSQAVGGGISVEKVEPYTGSYYIRTDCAGNTKWDSYKNADHLMPYSEYSIDHGGYSHYYTHWVQTGDRPNIKFVVANDYSSAISDTLIRESNAAAPWTNINGYIDENGNILRNANVRFMWNQSTNKVSRAYVDGAQGDNSDNFLYMVNTDSPNMIRWSSSTGLTSNKVTFLDNGDWIYEANIEAQPDAAIRVLSNWGTSSTVTQYFRGTSSKTEKLIGGSGSDWYKIRVIYDFKTNRLISSFVPSDQNITTENAIEADVMFIREHQGDIAQLTFGENGKISKIETAYGVMRFNKWTLNNKSKEGAHAILGDPKSIYERSLFWISFPFRVKLSEVIGFGTYGTHWAVQRYDGAGRAANGYWAESSSYWRWMNRNTEYLEPDQGYLLAIDLDLLGESSSLFANTDQLEIYFPSYGTMPDITSADVTQTIPEHECTINWAADKGLPDTGDPRTSYNRTVFDSHWNVMSVPTYVNTDDVSFANTTWITSGTGHVGPKFLYTWNPDDNTITATTGRGYTYHAMHAYMVQYGGTVTWSASSGSPASIVARRTYAEQPREVEFRLELQQDSVMIDRTYVALSNDEQTSAGFRFGEDMTKEFNANKSSIYTFIANEATVAGNTLPMTEQTTVVPMGVEIKTAGDYTFAIPDGTEGIGVTLIDTETGIRTSLSALDYTVNLTAGKHDSRFVLEISPIQQMPTDIDQLPIINDQSSVKKVLIDGLLYIVKDGQLFDATGKVVTR